jgi:hypothetical protein
MAPKVTKHPLLRPQYAVRLLPTLEEGAKVLEIGGLKGSVVKLSQRFTVRSIQSAQMHRPPGIEPTLSDNPEKARLYADQFVVGQVPFARASRVLKRLLEANVPGALLVVQREVAQKLLTRYGLLAARISVSYIVTRVCEVPPHGFTPAYRHATILSFERRKMPLAVRMDYIVEAYTHMRKRLKGLAKRPAELTEVEFEEVFRSDLAERL